MRFLKDPEWGEGCLQARRGIWTESFIDLINSRLLHAEVPITSMYKKDFNSLYDSLIQTVAIPDGSKGSEQPTVYATPDNETRSAINGAFIKQVADTMPDEHYPIRITANFHGSLNKHSRNDRAFIMGLNDAKFGRLAPFLDVFIGMPIIVTQNLEPSKGVANGTPGILHDIQFPLDTKYTLLHDHVLGMTVLLPNTKPLVAWIRVDRGAGALSPPASGDLNAVDMFPIFPTKAFKQVPITLPSGLQFKTKITQLPFICAAGSTVYKL